MSTSFDHRSPPSRGVGLSLLTSSGGSISRTHTICCDEPLTSHRRSPVSTSQPKFCFFYFPIKHLSTRVSGGVTGKTRDSGDDWVPASPYVYQSVLKNKHHHPVAVVTMLNKLYRYFFCVILVSLSRLGLENG